jgi:hypothetical protein
VLEQNKNKESSYRFEKQGKAMKAAKAKYGGVQERVMAQMSGTQGTEVEEPRFGGFSVGAVR